MGSLQILLRVFLIALGAFCLAWQPSEAWVERAYANGGYAAWEHAVFPIANALPWSLGDVAAGVGIVAIVWRLAIYFRARKRGRVLAMTGLMLLDVAAVLGLYAVWFETSWGWNYARAPIETRVEFDKAQITTKAATDLRTVAMSEMNRLAAPAHARSAQPLNRELLYNAWLPVVQRGGDDWAPDVGKPKPTLFDPFMQATGTSGFINPLTLNVQLAGDVLWFERPFDLAHEWSHVAAYAREDEANYIAIVTCLRSKDPVVQYSGWFELFLYLPPKPHYARREFVPLVWQDFAAIRQRDEHHVNTLLAHWSWRTYNAYLKTNRIASGIENYNEVTRLILGVSLDLDGLPTRNPKPS